MRLQYFKNKKAYKYLNTHKNIVPLKIKSPTFLKVVLT